MISTLHGGLEAALVIALLSAYLRGIRQRGLFPFLAWGAALSASLGLGLTFAIASGWDREPVELMANGTAAMLALALILSVVWRREHGGQLSGGRAFFWGAPVFLATASMVTIPSLGIGLTQWRALSAASGDTGYELVARSAAALMVLIAASAVGMSLYRATARTRLRWVTLVLVAVVSVMLVRDATAALQVMLARGMMPLTDWLFRIMVLLVNSYPAFIYAILGLAGVLVVLAILEWRRRQGPGISEGLNPAERRKKKAEDRGMRGRLSAAGLILALVVLGDVSVTSLANRPVKLSPATPVEAENGRIAIPEQAVADGRLHRFSFAAGEDSTVRFLVLYKGSGVYGVGLDACEFCGVAGYREDGENIICNRCGAAINNTTIGFPGGCNPIPLDHLAEGGLVVIPLEGIMAVKSLFAN